MKKLIMKKSVSLKLSLLVALASLLSACANVPHNVELEAPSSDFIRVAQQPSAFVGNQVRWGGIIARVENHEQDTLIEIVHLPLDRQARPSASHDTGGRFIARVQQFLDPVIYAQGKEITVVGIVSEPMVGKVGQHTVNFPVVDTSGHYLWEKRKTHRHIDYYHSTWDPFWFYSRPYRWPYYRHLGYIHFSDYGWYHYNHYYGRRAVGHNPRVTRVANYNDYRAISSRSAASNRHADYRDSRVTNSTTTDSRTTSSSTSHVLPPKQTTRTTPPPRPSEPTSTSQTINPAPKILTRTTPPPRTTEPRQTRRSEPRTTRSEPRRSEPRRSEPRSTRRSSHTPRPRATSSRRGNKER